MNGVGNEETLAAHVARVIRGTTFPAGKVLEPGVVQWDVKGDTTFGPFDPQAIAVEAIAPLADACTRAGMPASAVADARPSQWRKVIFNAATNPMGALTGLTHGRLCERPDLRAVVSGLVDEGKAVAAAQGIELDADPEALIDHAARPDVAYGHKASMLQDVEARRATEIDYLNGGIARFGRELGVPTPLHDTITALIKGVEASWQQSETGARSRRSSAVATRTSAQAMAGARSRRARRRGKRVLGLRGRRDVHVRLPDRAPLCVRRASGRRRRRSSSSRPRRATSASTGRP